MYLGEDKVASLGSICNVSGSASKNLFNINLIPSGDVITNNGDGTLTFANNSSNVGYVDIGMSFSQIFDGVVGNTYIANFNNSFSDSNRNYRFYLLSANLYINKNTPFVLTQEMLDSNVILYGGYKETSTMSDFQIEKGSTATEYEEYYEPTISIKDSKGDYHEVPYMTGKASKNLFNENDVLKGYWINNGVNEANALWDASSFIKVEPNNSYSFSSSLISGKSEIQATLNYYDNNKNYISNTYFQTLTKTEKTPSNCYYARIAYRNDVLENIQFEKGSTITSYEEYYEPSLSIKNSNGVFQEVELNAPVILYTSESGTFDPITLTEEVEHFKYVEVFGVGNTMICSVKIPMDLYNTGSLFTAGASYQYQCGVSLTGKSMTFIYNRRLNISSNAWDNGNYFKIYRIIGYR